MEQRLAEADIVIISSTVYTAEKVEKDSKIVIIGGFVKIEALLVKCELQFFGDGTYSMNLMLYGQMLDNVPIPSRDDRGKFVPELRKAHQCGSDVVDGRYIICNAYIPSYGCSTFEDDVNDALEFLKKYKSLVGLAKKFSGWPNLNFLPISSDEYKTLREEYGGKNQGKLQAHYNTIITSELPTDYLPI